MLCTVGILQLILCATAEDPLHSVDFTEKFAFWHEQYSTACTDAVRRDRPLFIVFCDSATDLGRSVRAGYFCSESVERTLRGTYVRLHVDLATDAGRSLAARFQVSVQPSVVILDRSTKWTIFEHAGYVADSDLQNALDKYRYCKLGPNGKPIKTPSSSNRTVVASTPSATAPADSVNVAAYRGAVIRNIDETAFEREVIEVSKERDVVVDFWAEWCGPCRALAPVLERHVREREGELLLIKINVDQAPNLMARYRIESIPAVKVFRDGKPVLEFVGLQSDAELRQTLDRLRAGRSAQIGGLDNTRR